MVQRTQRVQPRLQRRTAGQWQVPHLHRVKLGHLHQLDNQRVPFGPEAQALKQPAAHQLLCVAVHVV